MWHSYLFTLTFDHLSLKKKKNKHTHTKISELETVGNFKRIFGSWQVVGNKQW
jgi:hypothetical protein